MSSIVWMATLLAADAPALRLPGQLRGRPHAVARSAGVPRDDRHRRHLRVAGVAVLSQCERFGNQEKLRTPRVLP
jgi:hypothetical protein